MQRVKLALAEAEANVASMRVRLGETQARLAQMTAAANRVPQIDAEFAQLNRDYDVVRRQYEAMVAKREKAALSEDIDATRLAQFRVIDPPRVSPNPVFPNRTSLLFAVLLVVVAAGVGASFVVSQVDSDVRYGGGVAAGHATTCAGQCVKVDGSDRHCTREAQLNDVRRDAGRIVRDLWSVDDLDFHAEPCLGLHRESDRTSRTPPRTTAPQRRGSSNDHTAACWGRGGGSW